MVVFLFIHVLFSLLYKYILLNWLGGIIMFGEREEIFEKVSNTYLVFRKIKEEFFEGQHADDEELNKILVGRIKGICEFNLLMSNEFPHLLVTLKRFKDFTICREYYDYKKLKRNFYLLMFETSYTRILLNYIDASKRIEPLEENYFPRIKGWEMFSKIHDIKGIPFTIINTFDAFTSFADRNNEPYSVKANLPFYNRFIYSVNKTGSSLENGTIQSCIDLLTGEESTYTYNYAVFDGIILIYSYKKYA